MNQKVLGFVVVFLSAFLVASILAAEIQQTMPSVDGPVISVKIQLILRDTLLAAIFEIQSHPQYRVVLYGPALKI
jgi:hypothetical protein